MELCCIEYCEYLRESRLPTLADTFYVTFHQLSDGISMTIESAGAPCSIIINDERRKQLIDNMLNLTETEIRQLLLASIPQSTDYRYMFGINITTLTFKS